MTTAVENADRDLSPLEVRLQTHRRYSETEQDVEADVVTARHMLYHVDDPAGAYLLSTLTLLGVPEEADLRCSLSADLDATARAGFRTVPGGIWRDPKGCVIVSATA